MDLVEKITHQFETNMAVTQGSLSSFGETLTQAIDILIETLTNDHKVLVCGNGVSALQGQYFTNELLGRCERERPGLAALSLSADGALLSALTRDYGFDDIFARQIRALGQPGDLLVVFAVEGDVQNLVQAVHAAKERDMIVLLIGGQATHGLIASMFENDIQLIVPNDNPKRVAEVHLLLIHCLTDGIDCALFGDF